MNRIPNKEAYFASALIADAEGLGIFAEDEQLDSVEYGAELKIATPEEAVQYQKLYASLTALVEEEKWCPNNGPQPDDGGIHVRISLFLSFRTQCVVFLVLEYAYFHDA